MTVLDYYPQWLGYQRWLRRIPGVQVAARHRGELRLAGSFGWSDVDADVRLADEHLFRIASHSKTFASVLALQLVQTGRLRLDDALADLVPELSGAAVGDRTLRELLSHSGGVVRDGTDGDFWQSLMPFPDRAELITIARDPSAAVIARNEHFKYSNIAYGLVGLVLEAVTGSAFADLVRIRVAEPLALTDTGGEYDPSRANDYAAGYTSAGVARIRTRIEHIDTRALAAATGCYATARDLTAFYSELLTERDRLLGPDALRQLRHPVWDVKAGERRYGLGVFLDRLADTEVFGHTGGYPGHITCTQADPATGWVLSVLTNAIDGAASALAAGFWHLRGLANGAGHATASDEEAARFVGRYAAQWGVLDVVHLDGRLFSISPADPNPAEDAVALEVIDSRSLRIAGGRGGNSYGETMRFEHAEDGSVRSVRGDSGMTLTPFTVPDEP